MSCKVDGCENSVFAAELCSKHYNRLRKTGTTEDGPRARLSLEERFWRNVAKGEKDECWYWLAKSKVSGYGAISIGGRGGKKILAHRLSWELHNGQIPGHKDYHGMVVMHSCDNRLCVNPNHLSLGRQIDNVRDMDAKGRRKTSPKRGSKHHMTAINEDEAASIFAMPGKYREIAEKFGCSIHTVKGIKASKTWVHVTKNLTRGKNYGYS